MVTKPALKPSELKNPDKLTKDHLNKVTHYLSRLKELDAQVAARTIRYVVDGTDEEVLLTLAGMKKAAETLRLANKTFSPQTWNQLRDAAKERAHIMRPGVSVAPVFYVRLGHVLEAVRRATGAASQPLPNWPNWLCVLVSEIIQGWIADDRSQDERPSFDLADLEAVLREASQPTGLLASAFLDPKALSALQSGSLIYGHGLGPFKGWNDYLARHLDVVREAFAPTDADHRLYVLGSLRDMGFDFTPVVDHLVEYATGSAKTVREASLVILAAFAERARPLIEKVLVDGDASRRHEAAQALWRLFGRDAAETLRGHAATESSERIKQTIEKLLAAPQGSAGDVSGELAASLPPVHLELGNIPLTEEAKQRIRDALDYSYKQHLQNYERSVQQYNAPNRPKWLTKPNKPQPLSQKALGTLFDFVEGKAQSTEEIDALIHFYAYARGPFGEWFAPPQVHLIHVVRLDFGLGHIIIRKGEMWWRDLKNVEAYRARCPEPFGLRELDAAVATLPGCESGAVARTYLAMNSGFTTFCDWEAEAVWPVFVEHPEVLHEILRPGPGKRSVLGSHDYMWPHKRRNTFKVLAAFPQLPPEFIPLLWDLALGETKTDRPLAQAALAKVSDKTSKILIALQDGRQGVRAAAAEWLGKIGDPAAIEPLKAAFRKEKQEVGKGAIMTALEACGADVGEFLDRGVLSKEAEAGLAKKPPKGLEWFPFDSLPALHWQDNTQAVDPRVVQWWLVQCVQQKSPVCGPLLRRYLGMCRKNEAAALARFVLSAWIAHDTRTPPHEEAAKKAREQADQLWSQVVTQNYWVETYKNDKENLYRQLLAGYANEFLGSAIDQKGMLAVVAAAGDGDCVKMCEGYIRKYFGNKLAHCKALVEVLAWVPHPLGIQVLLSLANRFRTKSIRQAAEEHVQALAEREGWTIDELADRTIPDAGFERPLDESGVPVGADAALILDYGPRKFIVKLDDDLDPVITTEEGKAVKNPPAAAKADDEEKANAAKKAFSDAKKTVKEVVKRQSERLYESLCTQRSWRFEDWRRFLADHPIVGRLCVRLAWAAFAGEQPLGVFRPLEDGSLTNEKDEEVRFEPDTIVRLAHTCNTPSELSAAWIQHFTDYDITPLFAQFGRATYSLPEQKQQDTDITDFEGHQLTTFKLRSKSTKLGYIRGDAEDGGCFTLYRKPFPSLGLQAILSFTGSTLPEQDVPAALDSLYFMAIKGDKESATSWDLSKLPLGKIPPVLLSECYNDVKQIAAEDSGFDPKWREKSYF
jgi:hypothetical protein